MNFVQRFPGVLLFVFALALTTTAVLIGCGQFFPPANQIVSIRLSPLNSVVAPGKTVQYTATATFGNNTTGDATSQVSWASSATNVATINSAGLATGVSLGTTTITASSGSVRAQTGLTVSNQTVTGVTVSPSSVTLIAGQNQQLSAKATFSDNSTQDVTNSATWSSNATNVATVTSTGFVTAVSTGTATITATFGGQPGSATVSVQ
jgi:uncharacterized protein YjdB